MSWSFVGNVREAQAVTALPTNPEDGDQIIFMDSLTAPTYQWLLRYVAAKSSNKWVCIGGVPAANQVETNEARASTTWGALATAGPSITLPVAGDYDIEIGCVGDPNVGANEGGLMSYSINASTAASDADSTGFWGNTAGTSYQIATARTKRKTGLSAVAIVAVYKTVGGNSMAYQGRWMRVMPVAVGG
jgi:hypothetical protein